MLDLSKPLRKAYYNILNGNVTSNAAQVGVYDKVPSGAAFPYIYFSSFTDEYDPISDKDKFCHDCTMTLVACMNFQGNAGGQAIVDDIIDQVTNLIRGSSKQSLPFSISINFSHIICEVENTTTFTQDVADGVVCYRTIKFRHKINQI